MYTRCDNAAFAKFVAAISRTNSNWFEFVRLVAATKFCRSDNDFHEINRVTQGELLWRLVAATYRLLCPGLKCFKTDFYSTRGVEIEFKLKHYSLKRSVCKSLTEFPIKIKRGASYNLKSYFREDEREKGKILNNYWTRFL